ncbi:DNA-directed RNA polymerase specialized sigma24 family protein [Ereboglobus sp. PH5-10]|uniref:RNA polymerase sigma factor n=1 Tax=unclassified Ereboglobus TaxID=2626932 RepID=UPI002405E0C0|nr:MULTISPECIES: sigma-70 family RNA polymerase sigma factor [unclassified Ereboglobus]MDF9827130.1 DNA-directed RNA polymerase specialized sigma24 family protein [Ereboglobus sp. PH5-10]
MQSPHSNNPTCAVFATTQWNVVYAAAQSQQPGARDALTQLCRNYWTPLYAFARRQGLEPHSARDLVQGFFESLLANRTYANATPTRGKFRTFLIGGLKHYQNGLRDRANAQKRGGGAPMLSLDENIAETHYAADSTTLTPEKIYERQWALAVIDHALANLRAEFAGTGDGAAFDIMAPFLTGDSAQSYDDASAALGITASAFKAQLHRLRVKFRAHLRREIAGTVGTPLEIDEEMRNLRQALVS